MKKDEFFGREFKRKINNKVKVNVKVKVGVSVFVLPLIIGGGVFLYFRRKSLNDSNETDCK